ncbi:MAG TPA: hypothetical protein VI363_03355 [Burkholderiales bacterium]
MKANVFKQGKTLWHAVLLASVVALAAPCASADVGIGAAVSEGVTILVPIRKGSWMIEPEFFFENSTQFGNHFQDYSLGAGIYSLKELGPLFESYVGARFAYARITQESGPFSQKLNGFSVAPTLGVQHFFSKQFSLGLDVGLRYERDTENDSLGNGHPHNLETQTRVLVRAFF